MKSLGLSFIQFCWEFISVRECDPLNGWIQVDVCNLDDTRWKTLTLTIYPQPPLPSMECPLKGGYAHLSTDIGFHTRVITGYCQPGKAREEGCMLHKHIYSIPLNNTLMLSGHIAGGCGWGEGYRVLRVEQSRHIINITLQCGGPSDCSFFTVQKL